MSNWRFEAAKSQANTLLRYTKDDFIRKLARGIIEDINAGIFIDEKRMEDLRQWSIRNPGFDGDEIGRPDDDFDDPPTLNGRKEEDDEE